MHPSRPPAPPPPGFKPARLTTIEEDVAPINGEYAALLANVHGKGAPRRFLEPIRERPNTTSDHRFTEAELDSFLRSLDAHLYPAALAEDAGVRRIWRAFWDARTASFAAFLRRLIDETAETHARKIDPAADVAELAALERAIARALLRADRARLRAFIGRRGVTILELTFALWSSHAEAWFLLATAPAVLPALGALMKTGAYADGVEHARPSADFGAHSPRAGATPAEHLDRRRAARPRAVSGGLGMKPYQALAGVPGRAKSSNK